MARQRSLHLVLGFACSLAAVGCDDSDDKFGMLDSGVLAPPGSTAGTGATGAAAGGTTGITTPGGTTGMTLPGGTTGTTLPGGTTGMTTPGGTTGMSMPGGTTGMTTPGGTTGMTTPGGTTGMTMPGGTTGMSSPGGTTGMGSPGGAGLTPPPAKLSGENGPMRTASYDIDTGKVYHPTGNDGPWAAIAIIPGFANSGPEIEEWCPFYASWGIVCHVTWTGALDFPDQRAVWLADAIKALKAENTKAGSPLNGKLSGAYGTSGYSMGGGASTIAAASDKSLKVAIGLAPWTPVGGGVTTPTLHFCGDADITADCSHAQASYDEIPDSTPKMMITIRNCGHLDCWWGPEYTPGSISGGWGLAFAKVYLEGDMRWKSLLLQTPSEGTVQTNIDP